jgi:hypothetical protein
MSMSLEEALSQVELETGKTYRCKVKGQMVVVKVVDSLPPSTPPVEIDESDLMMEAWTSLPLPPPRFRVIAKPGKLPPPDRPDIPLDEDEAP